MWPCYAEWGGAGKEGEVSTVEEALKYLEIRVEFYAPRFSTSASVLARIWRLQIWMELFSSLKSAKGMLTVAGSKPVLKQLTRLNTLCYFGYRVLKLESDA